jgi:hypothetical protein
VEQELLIRPENYDQKKSNGKEVPAPLLLIIVLRTDKKFLLHYS